MNDEKKRESTPRPPRTIYVVVRDDARKRKPTSRLVTAHQRGVLTGLLIALAVLLARVYLDQLMH